MTHFLARAEILTIISLFLWKLWYTTIYFWDYLTFRKCMPYYFGIYHLFWTLSFFQTFFSLAKLMRQFFLDMKHKIENLLKPMTIACVICMPEIQCHCHPCLHWTCQLHLALHRPLAVVLPTKIWKIGMFILTFDTCH